MRTHPAPPSAAPRARRTRVPMLLLALVAGGLACRSVAATVPVTAPRLVQNPRCGLATWEARAGTGGAPFVLLHGYGSSPQEWFPFLQTIRPPAGAHFVFPTGPEATVPPDGPADGRAWWRLGLEGYIPPGGRLPDLAQAQPEGLRRSSADLAALLRELTTRLGVTESDVIVGGFSQGAMIAADLAFRTRTPLRALVLLSGTPVDEATWLAGAAHRRALPVFLAHGRSDPTLPYGGTLRLATRLRDAGLPVTFVPFDGGHEIPPPVVEALNRFLETLPPTLPKLARASQGT